MELKDNDSEQQQGDSSAKKRYQSPELLVYGSISELTKNVTATMNADNPAMKS
jgi:hypothetical protein